MKRLARILLALALVGTACGGSETTADTATTDTGATEGAEASVTTKGPTTTAQATTTTAAATTTTAAATTTTAAATTTTTGATTTTTEPAEPALSQDGDTYAIVWASTASPFWAPANESAADPFFHIHTEPDQDGFFFSLEMYTTGYGALWTGELGEVEVLCMEGVPGPSSTGICPYFDPDGPGPIEVNSAFVATGSITINQLDENGYDIVVNEIVYPNGTTITSFQLTGP